MSRLTWHNFHAVSLQADIITSLFRRVSFFHFVLPRSLSILVVLSPSDNLNNNNNNNNIVFRSGNTLHGDTQVRYSPLSKDCSKGGVISQRAGKIHVCLLWDVCCQASPKCVQTSFGYSEPSSDTSSDRCVNQLGLMASKASRKRRKVFQNY